MAKRILLADADAFYVAVARLVDPEGAGRAPLLIVGGSAEHRGVVTSASYEARRFGIHSAMPTAQALRLCPGATVVPVPMRACVEKGREIRRALLQFTPVVQQASSDEFYLDMSGTEKLYHGEPLAETAKRMRQAVLEATHLTVSIGGGTSRVVAKLAGGVAKPSSPLSPLPAGVGNQATGVFIVPDGEEVKFMRRFSLADIHGVGPRFQDRLARLGLITVNDALAKDEQTLAACLGSRAGKWLFDRIRGVDDGFVPEHQRAKSISRDETFAEDIDDDAALNERLLELVDRATSDLRGYGWLARTVTVRLRDNDFTDRQASRTVRPPISSDRAVLAVARNLLRRLRTTRRIPARLLGVVVSNFVEEEAPSQLSLFQVEVGGVEETARDRAVAQAIDHLRRRFGHDAIVRGRTTD